MNREIPWPHEPEEPYLYAMQAYDLIDKSENIRGFKNLHNHMCARASYVLPTNYHFDSLIFESY
jgi:hypothetical protein